MLKKLVEFIRAKFASFSARNTTLEDRYTQAANALIDQIHLLKTRLETSKAEKVKLTKLAREKRTRQESKEKEIKYLMETQPTTDLTTHVKLALLYRNTAAALDVKAAEIDEIQAKIKETVVELDDKRQDIAVKLEYIREAKSVDTLGIDSVEDVILSAGLTEVDVDTILRRVDTFNGESVPAEIQTTSADIAEYLESLKSK